MAYLEQKFSAANDPSEGQSLGTFGHALSHKKAVRILVAEDDFMMSDQIVSDIEMTGNTVVGPFASIEAAAPFIAEAQAAILDIRLGRLNTFDLAMKLRMRRCPFLFYTSFSPRALPDALRTASLHNKPTSTLALLADLDLQNRDIPLKDKVFSLLPFLRMRARQLVYDQAAADRLVAATLEKSISQTAMLYEMNVTPFLFQKLEREFMRYGREYMI